MGLLDDMAGLASKPIAALSHAFNAPNAAGRYRPFYVRNVLDAVAGRTLADAVDGRTVLVTGASSGIGEATAKRVAAAGGRVVLVARTPDNLHRVAQDIEAAGGSAHVYPCDLSDGDAISDLADCILADLGGVDVLINNAGRSIRRSLELSYDRLHDYERTMQLNYLGAVALILKFVPGMRERGYGHVVNVSSVGVLTRVPRFGAYLASKAALDTLCDSLQGETLAEDVRFTTVHMALVRTPMISPTTLYDRFPTLTPEQAATVMSDALTHRPRRVSSPIGQAAAMADAFSPALMDHIRHLGYRLFPDTAAAPTTEAQPTDPLGTAFIAATPGIHW